MLPGNKQQMIVTQEGIEFDQTGKCDLSTYLWEPTDEVRTALVQQSE